MGAMHGIAGLECNHAPPAQARKFRAQLRGRQAQGTKIVMGGRLQAFQSATHVPGIRLVDSIVCPGMRLAGSSEYALGFRLPIGLPDIFDVQHRQHHAFAIAQSDLAAARLQFLGELFGHIERDGHRPDHATLQAHVVTDAFVIRTIHEAAQGRESAAQQQFDITNLSRRQVPRRPFFGMRFQIGGARRLGNEVDQFPAMRGDKMARRSQICDPP